MENLNYITIVLITLGVLYWGVLIGSLVWHYLVCYVSGGEKTTITAAQHLLGKKFGDGWDKRVYREGEGYRIDGFSAYACSLILMAPYALGCAFINTLIHDGYGTPVLLFLCTLVTLVTVLRLAKWVYAINSKLNKHQGDKNAHK